MTMGDVPVRGSNIPLVIPGREMAAGGHPPAHVDACVERGVDVRLTPPAAQPDEGHIPRIALTTGGADALECLMRKIGIDDSEFTPEAAPGGSTSSPARTARASTPS